MNLRQLFCRHDWEKISDKMVAVNRHYIVPKAICRCKKCGRVKLI